MAGISYKKTLKKLFSLDDTPHKIALSFAVGVYISISPFYGFHTVLAITLSLLFGLNKVATVTGSFFNNPWTIFPIYYVDYKVGAFILRDNKPFNLKPFTFHHYWNDGKYALLDILVGSVVMGVLISIVSYFVIRYLIENYKRRRVYDTTKG